MCVMPHLRAKCIEFHKTLFKYSRFNMELIDEKKYIPHQANKVAIMNLKIRCTGHDFTLKYIRKYRPCITKTSIKSQPMHRKLQTMSHFLPFYI